MKDMQFCFSYNQDVTAVTNSQCSVDFGALADYGVGRPFYITVQACGTHDKDLRIQVLGCEDNTFSKPVVLNDSNVIPKASLVQGYEVNLQVPQVDQKYRFLALRYIPSDPDTPSKGNETVSGGSAFTRNADFDPPRVVGKVPTAVKNAVTAFGAINIASSVDYPQANADKITR